tara:strand:- start:124 stop:408 length:285 start_codon:yes stop_codon:yes gene_type:complete
MGTLLLDPTSQPEQQNKAFAVRLDTLSDKTIGLLDINKAKGVFFLDRLEEILREQYGVKEVLRRTKLTPGRPAADAIQHELQEKCDAVIEALSD